MHHNGITPLSQRHHRKAEERILEIAKKFYPQLITASHTVMQQGTVPVIGGSLGHRSYKRNYVVGFICTKTNQIIDVKIATRTAKHTNGNHTGFPQGEEADEVLRKATRNINWFENFFLTAICKYLCVRRELRHEE